MYRKTMKTLYRLIMLSAAIAVSASVQASPKYNVKGRITAEGKPVAGVQVSDGRQIVLTDAKGCYKMLSDKADSMLFITTPSGYIAQKGPGVTPAFFAMLTKPASKCEKHDFELVPQDQKDYSVLMMSDIHFARVPAGVDRSEFKRLVLPCLNSLIDQRQQQGKAVFCFQFGDFDHDSMWYANHSDEIAAFNFLSSLGIKAPFFGVSGNHDNDGAITEGDATDSISAWQVRRTWGPDRFAMNIGKDHWIFLDNIIYKNTPVAKPVDNINGDRSYDTTLKPDQLEWLKKDLEYVPDGTRIYLCMHCPAFNTANPKERIPDELVSTLDGIFSRFPKVTVFSGHAHMMHIPSTGKYTRFEQFVLPALSGNMWQTNELGYQCVCSDGTSAGILTADNFASANPDYDYVTTEFGPKAMRIYDMNAVAEYYRNDPGVRYQMNLYSPKYKHDFADGSYTNKIFINYWFHRPGETVHAYENGVELDVKMEKMEDPLYNISYFVPYSVNAGKFKKSLGAFRWPHMFVAQAATADAPVVVKVLDEKGRTIREETLTRPKAFDKNAR